MNGASAMCWLISQRNKQYNANNNTKLMTQQQIINNEFPQPIQYDSLNYFPSNDSSCNNIINEIFSNQLF